MVQSFKPKHELQEVYALEEESWQTLVFMDLMWVQEAKLVSWNLLG